MRPLLHGEGLSARAWVTEELERVQVVGGEGIGSEIVKVELRTAFGQTLVYEHIDRVYASDQVIKADEDGTKRNTRVLIWNANLVVAVLGSDDEDTKS